jgi:hypothetical protein
VRRNYEMVQVRVVFEQGRGQRLGYDCYLDIGTPGLYGRKTWGHQHRVAY